MPRQPRPWRREGKGRAWYAQVGGRQVWLAPAGATRTEAQAALHQILAARGDGQRRASAAGLTVRDVLNLFLADCEAAVGRGELAAVTLEGYSRYLIPARDAVGRYAAASLRAAHVTAWLDSRPGWNSTSRYNAITAIKRAFAWARDAGHVATHPIERMPRPVPARRAAVLTPEQVARLVAAVREGDPFRELLEAIRETGCRPGEACRLTADRVDLAAGTWTVPNKTRHSTGEATRTVYLSPHALAVTRRAVECHPAGQVFRNRLGRPWTRNAVALRMRRLGARLGLGSAAVAYSLRHAWCTDALERGVPPATVAELMGHRSLAMVVRVYSRLRERTEHLRSAAGQARGGS